VKLKYVFTFTRNKDYGLARNLTVILCGNQIPYTNETYHWLIIEIAWQSFVYRVKVNTCLIAAVRFLLAQHLTSSTQSRCMKFSIIIILQGSSRA
jgi:hypothetical protein